MTDDDLLALCVYEESGAEIPDGKAAVARVIKNRMAQKFFSDGTIAGTILSPSQFSWAWFSFQNGKYSRCAWSHEDAVHIAEEKLITTTQSALDKCRSIAYAVFGGVYRGALYDHLTDEALMYLNPRIASKMPSWASADKLICSIGNHSFYHK